MEKLMTTFAKSKKDIIKDALKEAERAATSENKNNEVNLKSSLTKKRRTSRPKKSLSLPWKKSALKEDFRQSCHDFENLIVAGFHSVLEVVNLKHAKVVSKFKDDLLRYLKNHRYLEESLVVSSSKESKTDLPWQKQKIQLSENFSCSCDDLENLIITGFDKICTVVSQKHINAIKALKDELLGYLNNYHRKLKLLQKLPSVAKPKKETSGTASSNVESKVIPSESVSEAISSEASSEIVLSDKNKNSGKIVS